MSTLKNIEKIKKLMVLLTIGLIVIGVIAGFSLYLISFNRVNMAGVLT